MRGIHLHSHPCDPEILVPTSDSESKRFTPLDTSYTASRLRPWERSRGFGAGVGSALAYLLLLIGLFQHQGLLSSRGVSSNSERRHDVPHLDPFQTWASSRTSRGSRRHLYVLKLWGNLTLFYALFDSLSKKQPQLHSRLANSNHATMSEGYPAIVSRETGGKCTLENVQVGAPQDDEVLVDMHATGVCHTDIAIMSGTFPGTPHPVVLGHEGGGVVLEVGKAVTKVAKGDKVLLSFAHCGSCRNCNEGHPAYCFTFIPRNFSCRRPDGSAPFKTSDGGEMFGSFFGQSSFASRSLVHENSLLKVSADTPLDKYCPIGCGQITGAGTVLNVLDLHEKDAVAVFGCGGVGLAAIMGAKLRNVKDIVAIDLHESRLSLAKELGATHTIGADISKDPEKLIAKFRELFPPDGVPHAIDCTGHVPMVGTMIKCLGLRGKGISLGAPAAGAAAQVEPAEHLLAGRSYIGVTEGDSIPGKVIPYLMGEAEKGNYPLDKLIKYYPAKDFQKAFDDMHSGSTIKAVLRWKD